jgi:cell division protein FtsA
MAAEEMERSGYEGSLSSGVVITGGGAQLEGLVEIGEQIFDLPVRSGAPSGVGGLVDLVAAPSYGTAVGVLLYGAAHQRSHDGLRVPTYLLSRMTEKVRDFFSGIFGSDR